MFGMGIVLGVSLFLVWKARDSYFRVEEGHVAVVTRFGAAHRQKDGSLSLAGPGLHFKWPFEELRVVSLREQLVTLGGETPDPMMLSDGTVIRVQSRLRYAPQRAGIEKYVFGLHHRKEHVTGLFTSLLRNEIANVKGVLEDAQQGAYAMVRKDRQLVNRRIADFAQKELGDRYGVDFQAVDITDIHPPDELAEALNAVMSARAEADTLRFRTSSECAQKVLAAEQGVQIASARAAASETEIDELGRHLATLEDTGVLEAYVDRRKTEVLSEARTLFVKDGGVV